MLYCKGNGLPRRFAPRNDMQSPGACLRLQERFSFKHSTRRNPAVFSMSLRASAHTGVAIRIPAGRPAKFLRFGRIREALRICPGRYFLQCCTARGTDCPVASLLTMTCNHLERVYVCKSAFLSNIPPAVTLLHAIVNQRIFNAEGVVKCLNKHENGRLQNLHFATGHLPFISLPIWYTAGTNR